MMMPLEWHVEKKSNLERKQKSIERQRVYDDPRVSSSPKRKISDYSSFDILFSTQDFQRLLLSMSSSRQRLSS